jgi:ABC-type antimicrobial peptide transport system permease subunit
MYANFYIAEIVETPEGIYPRANNYIWSDNHDFGYIYASEVELSKGLQSLGRAIEKRINEDDDFKEYYEKAIAVTGITIPDITEVLIDDHFVSHWSNQVLVKNKEGVKLDNAVDRITARLEKKGMEVKGTTVRTYMPHIAYMDRALAQVQIAAVFLPVFFYTVAMIVVGLFINQIIKAMTPQIGIFVSVGVGKWDIIKLFLIYTVLMAIASVIIGAPAGFALNIFLSGIMKKRLQ